MAKKIAETYLSKLMRNKEFEKRFNREYQNLLVSEQIASLRHGAHLTQQDLAERIHTTKSAISRYESAKYRNYSINLLDKIARACNAELKIFFAFSGGKKAGLRSSTYAGK